MISQPRFMIAAGASGSGKTLITCGILQALKQRGKKVSAFKCGPDYIDPMFHENVLHVKSRNLDTFFTDEEMTRYLFGKGARETDISVIEGVMGYYDGLGGIDTKASAYDLASVTETPVILVVNTKGMSLSVLAYIQGFLEFRKDSRIQGVILNQMSAMRYPEMKKQIEQVLGIKVFGYVPNVKELGLESRHLGLVLPEEVQNLEEKLGKLAVLLKQTLDLDGLLAVSETAPELENTMPEPLEKLFASDEVKTIGRESPVIAVARDEAFCFIYEDNLQLLKELGARVVFFSPLHDERIPEGVIGLLLYGGYPELYADKLEANLTMRKSIAEALNGGMPCMAECGGFMYLHEMIEDMEGKHYEAVGTIAAEAYRTRKLGRFGYIVLTARQKGCLGSSAGALKGHEFHYFDSTDCGESYMALKPFSGKSWKCIHGNDHTIMGFPHLYYYSSPLLVLEFLEKCIAFGGTKR